MRLISTPTRFVRVLALVVSPVIVFGACEGEPEVGEEVEAGADDAVVTDVQYFSDWDANDDGYLTVNEFQTGTDTATWWDDWDVDNDTYLSEDEFGSAFGDYAWYDEGLYDEWDADDDQLLSEEEWQTGVYDVWDADADQQLAENEFDAELFE